MSHVRKEGYFDVQTETINGEFSFCIIWIQFHAFNVKYKVHTVPIMNRKTAYYLAESGKLDSFYFVQVKDRDFTKNDELITTIDSVYKVDVQTRIAADRSEMDDHSQYNTEMAKYLTN